MGYIVQFLNGEITFDKFKEDLTNNSVVKKEINSLIPKEIWNEEHTFWKDNRINVGFYREHGFDMTKVLLEYKFDGELGDCYNIWWTVLRFYRINHHGYIPRINYEELFDLYLDTVGEFFEGPEVARYISDIIKECNTLKTKTAKRKAAKEGIKEAFKLENGKKPYWIQGAEWPMGSIKPMTFRYQKKKGEQVDYIFIDEDTGKERVVTQFY